MVAIQRAMYSGTEHRSLDGYVNNVRLCLVSLQDDQGQTQSRCYDSWNKIHMYTSSDRNGSIDDKKNTAKPWGPHKKKTLASSACTTSLRQSETIGPSKLNNLSILY